ncbi:MAG: TetR/AcrR family transcriptional regulator [Labilithrix sp.]|nr:TetR/AcrR family transcriptional regulator [Labilithrix sp.]
MASRPTRDLRRAILDRSLELVDKKGLDALSMREVARRLGVTHGAPYYHFKDRSSIVAALVEEGLAILAGMLEAAAREHEDPRAAFEACGRRYVAFAIAHPAYFRVMFRPELVGREHRASIDRAATQAFAVLQGVVVRCHAAGLSTGVDARALALTGWSTAHGLAALCLDGPLASKGDPKALAETVGATLGALVASGPKRGDARRGAGARRRGPRDGKSARRGSTRR